MCRAVLDLTGAGRTALAAMLKTVVAGYDRLFGFRSRT
jgi:hypothetical protein